jgi:hypothetical protein
MFKGDWRTRLKIAEITGPWDQEPDRDLWKHAGLACLVNRGPMGAWCGYVAVPPGHPAHRKHYNEVDVEVHGGLTYSEECQGVICHTPKPGEPDDVWWLGFDCGHTRKQRPNTWPSSWPRPLQSNALTRM